MTKYQHITQLYESELKAAATPQRWRQFLNSACRNYKCSFDEQLLIFAQRPDATAVLEINKWNNRFNRWVNRGASGIAVFDRQNPQSKRLKYYFDISDTHAGKNAMPVPVWQMQTEFEEDVVESLENSFGEIEDKSSFALAVMGAVSNIISDNLQDYLADFKNAVEGSFLEGTSTEYIEKTYKDLVTNSVAYMLLSRLDVPTEMYFDDDDFRSITDFSTAETLTALGVATGDISQMALREISATVQNLVKEDIRTFAPASEKIYTERVTNDERSNDNGDDIQQGGRLQSAEFDNAATAGSAAWEVRHEPQTLPRAEPQDTVHQSAHLGQIDTAFDRDRAAGIRDGGTVGGADGGTAGRERADESIRTDALGGADEQHPPLGTGDSDSGIDNGITSEILADLPTEEEQKNSIEKRAEQSGLFSISQDDIDAVLQRGSSVSDGKCRIFEQFQKKETAAENVAFLKDEYGIGGSSPAVRDRNLGEAHDGKGIDIIRRNASAPDTKISLSWKKVEKRIGELIAADRFLNDKEKEYYPAFQEKKANLKKRWEVALEIRTLFHDYNNFVNGLKEFDKALNMYVLSDCTSCFALQNKKTFTHAMKGDYALPLMIKALEEIIAEDIHFTDRAKNCLEVLNSDMATPILPDPEPVYGYEYHLGDLVYLGASKYEIVSFDDETVALYDETFPMLNKEMSRAEFDRKVEENPHNDHLKVLVKSANTHYAGYLALKTTHSNDIVMYKLGDFYEFYGEDAKTASEVLGIALMQRTVDDTAVTMCGVPKFSAENYIKGLTEKGYNVTLGDGDEVQFYTAQEAAVTEISVDDVISEITETPAEKEGANSDLVGKEITIDSRKYVVEEVRALSGDVSMRDVTFENSVGFPINRIEKAEFVRRHIPPETETGEPLTPPKAPKVKAVSGLPHPEVKQADRHQFIITDNGLGTGTKTEKFNANISAISLLKTLEEENRLATPDEQTTLSKYVGWGGLPEYFEETNSRYAELKNLLDAEEYAAARESTLTAFYTQPLVIKSIYDVLQSVGFKQGNILEPSCGTGNFMGLLPDSMKESKFFGVELDSISGRIAQQLYQKSSIAVQGYEKASLPESFFDVAVGNVPFGQFKVSDKKYDRHNWLIHDYFFGATLDKVRPGGIIAFITSKGTLDKANSTVRKYIAQRADLIGAIRLPNIAFKANAGTEVTSDIIFLQKRDRVIDIEPEWVHLGKDENGLAINQYFIDNPDMVLGEFKEISGPYGSETACVAYPEQELSDLLANAVQNIHAEYSEYDVEVLDEDEQDNSIPADPTVRNFSYTVQEGELYFRENSRMFPVTATETAKNRIKGMIEIRNSTRRLIELQTEDFPDSEIFAEQSTLNSLYDRYTKKYGLLSSRANSMAFSNDSSYSLLCSLEVVNEQGELLRKADMFTKRTIKPHIPITSVDTSSEALAVSLAEKAKVDMDFMCELTGKTEQEIYDELQGVIYLNPAHNIMNEKYLSADEYLSGNVREKLEFAKNSNGLFDIDYSVNIQALEKVQPKDLTASEISVRLGATWVPPEVVREFIFDLLDPPNYNRWNIHVHFSKYTAEWNIEGKSADRSNIKVFNSYGTTRVNAYKIIEETLNLKDVRVFDYVDDGNGKRTPVLNKTETAMAQVKQGLIKEAFANWIWKDIDRRDKLTRIYNDKFNSVRPREYDGQHISFGGINPEITLRKHQINAVARILYGQNTLLGHVVGAGKTYAMCSAAMELKRLGLCNKSMFVVPNHLTEQWAAEFLQLYPSANILVTTKKDFERKNRKKFCGRIATGDFDAVIIGHSQFEKIPVSLARQRETLENQLQEILDGIDEAKRNRGGKFTTKQLELTRKNIESKIEKLNKQDRKDDVVTFEELGIDRLFVDEAHSYKNLFAYSKMRNVGGISQVEAQKSSDMFMKCRYMDELTGGKGIIFATGTPVSNSMVEMFTMQRYLQMAALKKEYLHNFDAWAANFGETVTAMELSPEGKGYRLKTRFAKFYNLPELMCMFKEVADIQTADMLNLPVPKAEFINVAVEPSELQKEMVDSLAKRAEKVRNNMVDSTVDNMLLITNDGRKLALDQRLMNESLPDFEGSKVNACIDNVFKTWQENAESKATQLIFSDLSTPKKEEDFSVYFDIRDKLIAKGVPPEQIDFIHNANSDIKKKELFARVNSGEVRILLGSTAKMGAGTNVQKRLIASHNIDCPWRPSDLEQRNGRIIRQGNTNENVRVYNYVTKGTFDSYLYQLVEGKQRFISQVFTSKSPVRSAEDIDDATLSYAEIKMLATGNPKIKERMELDIEVSKLKMLKQAFLSEKYLLEGQVMQGLPREISALTQRVEGYKKDIVTLSENVRGGDEKFTPMTVADVTHTEKAQAGQAILLACKAMTKPDLHHIGEYKGFAMHLSFDSFEREYKLSLKGALSHVVTLGQDVHGNITRIDNALEAMPEQQNAAELLLENMHVQLKNAKEELNVPFSHDDELQQKSKRLDELNIELSMNKSDIVLADGDEPQAQGEKQKNQEMER